ncbi:MAG TPA: alpha/beta fold hydrolase, partial [Kofleriaceae bacterium]|nr:alpha/beta fold hydrolase [Kofleriaceae bacterium]
MKALLIHSGGFGGRQWRKLGEVLAPTHEVLAPDLLGYGSEPWPAGAPFHFRQDVERLAGLLGGEQADVVGHSYGGFLALQLALAHPELVRRIAVYDPVA